MNDSNRKKIMQFDKKEYESTNCRSLVGIAKLMIDYIILADTQQWLWYEPPHGKTNKMTRLRRPDKEGIWW